MIMMIKDKISSSIGKQIKNRYEWICSGYDVCSKLENFCAEEIYFKLLNQVSELRNQITC